MRMAETRRRMEASFGKRPATLVRRLIWALRVSHMLHYRKDGARGQNDADEGSQTPCH